MNTDRIARARAACEAATPGPWTTGPNTAAGNVWVYSRCDPLADPVNPRDWYGKAKNALYQVRRVWDQRDRPTGDLGCPSWVRVEANATFIALARTELPAALDALESARGALREIAFGGCCHALSPFPCVEDPELERDRWCLPCIARAELDKEQG